MSKVILVTGASTGLGAATARLLATGNDVIIHYNKSKVEAEKVFEEVKNRKGSPLLIQADLTTEQVCFDLVEKT